MATIPALVLDMSNVKTDIYIQFGKPDKTGSGFTSTIEIPNVRLEKYARVTRALYKAVGDIISAEFTTEEFSGTPSHEPREGAHAFATEHEVERHAEKQGCSLPDAIRFFEREGYDISDVEWMR